MNVRKITSRAAVAGVSTALAAGALVGATNTAAQAVDVTNTYNCSNAGLGLSFPSEMTVSGTIPAPSYGSGAPVPGGLINLEAQAAVPDSVAPLLSGAGVTGAKAKNYAAQLGTAGVPIPLSGDFVTEGGHTHWEASGSNTAFVTPAPGTYTALLPQSFTLTAMQGDTESVGLECVLADGQVAQSFGSIELSQQQSSVTVPKKATAKKGKPAKLSVKVGAALGVGMGKVVAKEGKKTLGTASVKNGKAVINLGKKLKVGKHKITVSYVENPSVLGSSAKVTLTVKK